MKIIRREYVRAVNEYCLEIDADYLKDLAKYVNREIANPKDNIALTEQDVADILNRNYGDKWNKTVLVKCLWRDNDFMKAKVMPVVIGDYVRECIDEDIWDSEFSVWDSEGDGYDDEIVR